MLDTVLVSDLHYGDRRCNLEQVACLLGHIGHIHRLIVVGDTLDYWVTKTWNLQSLLALLSGLCSHTVVLISGNHDPNNLDELVGDKIQVCDDYEVEAKKGIYKVIHGHQYDKLLCSHFYFVRFCFWIHQLLLNKYGWDFQRLLRFSLSNRSKSKYFESLVKESVEQMRSDYSGYAGVICGHTHFPVRVEFDDFEYFNCGDLIEHFSYIKINQDGEVSLCGYFPGIKS